MTAMFSKVWIINIVLAVLIIFCWIRIWDGRDAEMALPAQTVAVEKTGAGTETIGVAVARIAPSLEYEGIVEQNLFSSDRTFIVESAEPEAVVEAEARISGEKIVLYGVVVLDADKKALINNPMRKPGDRDFLWIREGDRLSNLRVSRIEPEQLLLNDGATQYKIDLYDPAKVRPKASPLPRASVPQQRDVPQVLSADPLPAAAPQVRPGTGAGTVVPAQPRQPRPAAASKKAVAGDDDEYEIIDTPFGEIRRKKAK